MRRLVQLLGLLVMAAACLPVDGAAAASYTVANTADSGAGSLRAAIEASNDPAVADTITITATGTIELETALPIVSDDVTINGPGATSLTITRKESAPAFRILYVSGPAVTISGLTVSGGVAASGAGIQSNSGDLTLIRVVVTGNEAFSEGGGTRYATGGGILNGGSLTLRESSVVGNAATAKGGDENLAGGAGIESEGTLFVERSTISGNFAQALGEGNERSEAVGGGLALVNGFTTVEESTISDNTAISAEAASYNVARGGGVWATGGLSITGSTIIGNAVEIDDSGSLIRNVAGDNLAVSGASIARNSLIALPAGEGEGCANGLVSGGFNLDEDGSCGFDKSSDLVDVVAGLDPVLKDNGGPTPTHALLAGSIAIDRGNSFGATIDQRGLLRPSDFVDISNKEGGDGSDIGAFELQAPPVPGTTAGGAVLVTETPGDRTPPNTRIVSGPPRNTFKPAAKFRFASTEAQSHFQCKLDKKKWKACGTPFKRSVRPGKHLFRVRAIDRFGNVDPTPARFGWRVKRISG
jgi:hypothetical protein